MLGSLVSAGASLLGGLLGKKSADKARESQEAANAANAALQREFAQNSIRWRVADARAAGIHPIYALGAPTISASPSYVGATADNSMGAALANAGQDIGRAINATRTTPERVLALQEAQLRLESLKLDNDVKRASLASSVMRLAQNSNPPMPAIGDGDFVVPEASKSEERPPLMLFGKRVYTPSGTSPMKAWEDQIGDDGPLSWLAQLAVGVHMLQHNFSKRAYDYLSSFPAFKRGKQIYIQRYGRR